MWQTGLILVLVATISVADRHDTGADLPSLLFGDDSGGMVEQDRQAYGSGGASNGIVNYLIRARPSRTNSGYGSAATGGGGGGGGAAPSAALRLQDPCTANADCANIADATCINGQCLCGTGFVGLDRIACVGRAGFLGDNCVISDQCANVDANAVCYKDRCVCEPLYYVASTLAVAGGMNYDLFTVPSSGPGGVGCVLKKRLRENCADDRECKYHTWDSRCVNGVCTCRAGFAPVGDHLCATKAVNLGDPCATDSQCRHIPFSECTRFGLCECRANDTSVSMFPVVAAGTKAGRLLTRIGRQSGNTCLPTRMLGESCSVSGQCEGKVLNSVCTSGNCACGTGFVRIAQSQLCLASNLAFNTTCLSSQQCASGLICNSTTQTCGCNHMIQATTATGTCLDLVAFGASCTDSVQCTTVGATCTGGVCACASNQNFSSVNNTCTNRVCNLFFSRDNYVCEVLDGCCRMDGTFLAAVGVFACQVAPSSDTSETSFSYSIADTTRFTILSNGSILLNSGQNVNGLIATTVTVTSNSDSTCTDTVPIEFMGQTCCIMPATVDTAVTSFTFTFDDTTLPANDAVEDCNPFATALANNGYVNPFFNALTQMVAQPMGNMMAFEPFDNLPCGSTELATAVITVTMDPNNICTVPTGTQNLLNGDDAASFDTAFTAVYVAGSNTATIPCVTTITGTTCNGVATPTAMVTFNFMCNNIQLAPTTLITVNDIYLPPHRTYSLHNGILRGRCSPYQHLRGCRRCILPNLPQKCPKKENAKLCLTVQ